MHKKYISKEEQKNRLLARIDDETKNWKFSLDDVKERALWKGYGKAYEDLLRHTSTRYAPWWVIPSDEKWFSRAVIGRIVVKTMEKMDLRFPKEAELRREIEEVYNQAPSPRGRPLAVYWLT